MREPEGNGTATSAAFTDPQKANEAFDLSKSVIPVQEILRGGPPKDGIPAISNPRMIPARNATFLQPTDRVVGVTAGEESRGYYLIGMRRCYVELFWRIPGRLRSFYLRMR